MKRNCLSYTLTLDGCKVALQVHDMPETWRSTDGYEPRLILRMNGWDLTSQFRPWICDTSSRVFLRGISKGSDGDTALCAFSSPENALAAFKDISEVLRHARTLPVAGGSCNQQRAESC